MARKINVNNINLYEVDANLISDYLSPFELGILLKLEPYSQDTDILLDNMMDFYLEEQEYLYCVIIRDEINSRKLILN